MMIRMRIRNLSLEMEGMIGKHMIIIREGEDGGKVLTILMIMMRLTRILLIRWEYKD